MALTADSPPSKQSAHERCYFLELPPELRLRIYEQLLSPEEVMMYASADLSITTPPTSVEAAKRFQAYVSHGGSVFPQLLAVCSQVHDEARPILYKISGLRICFPGPIDASKAIGLFKGEFRAAELTALTRLEHLVLIFGFSSESRKGDDVRSRVLEQSLRDDLSVGRLKICMRFDLKKKPQAHAQDRQQFLRIAQSVTAKLCAREAEIDFTDESGDHSWRKTAGADWINVFKENVTEPGILELKDVMSSLRFSDSIPEAQLPSFSALNMWNRNW